MSVPRHRSDGGDDGLSGRCCIAINRIYRSEERGKPASRVAINADAVLTYLLKGVNDDVAQEVGLVRLEAGGRITGKRCGTSQNIGAKARKAKV